MERLKKIIKTNNIFFSRLHKINLNTSFIINQTQTRFLSLKFCSMFFSVFSNQ